jgi:hypothetical protein
MQKKEAPRNYNNKEKEKIKKEVILLLLQVWKACSLVNTNGIPSW